jgi:hypothetical protein
VAITYAQKMQKVTATYTYYAPENVTLEEAKRTALDRAKLSAIADAYGTLVTQSNTMTCSREIEYNDIYIIFSPNAFTKANTNESTEDVLPRQLSFEDFQKWLVKVRKIDKEAIVNNKQISIKNKTV